MNTDDESICPRISDEESDKLFATMTQCTLCSLTMMDPMTLCCGHNFCQLCLAKVWERNYYWSLVSTLNCPICKQPWSDMPKINIQLRDIIEHLHNRECKRNLTSQDKKLVKHFSNAALKPWAADKECVGHLSIYLCIAAGALVGVICAFILWVQGGTSGLFSRKPVTMWSSEDVLVWVEGLGEWTLPDITGLFEVQALTGRQLLSVDNQSLVEFGVEQEFQRQRLLQSVKQLIIRDEVDSQPQGFYEFKAAHPRITLLLAFTYSTWPTLSLLYTYLFEYYTIYLPLGKEQFFDTQSEADLSGLQSFVFLVIVLVFPHIEICKLCLGWLYVYPWVCAPVLVNCFTDIYATVKQVRTFLTNPLKNMRTYLFFGVPGRLVSFSLHVIIYHFVWLIIPSLICDILFFVPLYWPHFLRIVLCLAPLLTTNRM